MRPQARNSRCGIISGLWKIADIDTVVDQAVKGIERRAARIVAPRNVAFIIIVPGFARAIIDRIGFPAQTIQEAIALIAGRTASKPMRGELR